MELFSKSKIRGCQAGHPPAPIVITLHSSWPDVLTCTYMYTCMVSTKMFCCYNDDELKKFKQKRHNNELSARPSTITTSRTNVVQSRSFHRANSIRRSVATAPPNPNKVRYKIAQSIKYSDISARC